MSMDPSKWIPFEQLSLGTKERIETVYPYLKLDQCLFQDKASGVFMKAINNVKIEKLLDSEKMEKMRPKVSATAPLPASAPASRRKK